MSMRIFAVLILAIVSNCIEWKCKWKNDDKNVTIFRGAPGSRCQKATIPVGDLKNGRWWGETADGCFAQLSDDGTFVILEIPDNLKTNVFCILHGHGPGAHPEQACIPSSCKPVERASTTPPAGMNDTPSAGMSDTKSAGIILLFCLFFAWLVNEQLMG